MRRVGISHDLEERKKYWKKKFPSLKNWRIVKSGLTYKEVQSIETKYIEKGYKGHLGGKKKYGKIYSVYTFSYN